MGFSSREKKDLVAIHGSEAVAVVVVNLRPTNNLNTDGKKQ